MMMWMMLRRNRQKIWSSAKVDRERGGGRVLRQKNGWDPPCDDQTAAEQRSPVRLCGLRNQMERRGIHGRKSCLCHPT